MKNIHVIPTDKPSRYVTNYMEQNMQFQNIYITSDEEIKEGVWILNNLLANKKPIIVTKELLEDGLLKEDKKIILTTDQSLIKDGVQSIDDEFLEWFVKNPSCEFADINDWMSTNGTIAFGGDKRYQLCNHLHNKIIIPKEKPLTKLQIAKNIAAIGIGKKEENSIKAKERAKNYMRLKGALDSQYVDFSNSNADKITSASTITIKQETLEEAAENYVRNESDATLKLISKYSFKDGAKWMQERMYSDMQEYAEFCIRCYEKRLPCIIAKDWFEQFKNEDKQ